MLASVTAQAAICKYSSAPRERTTNQRGGLDRGFCLFNNGTYMLVRNNNKYKTFQFQPRQQQHPKQGTPHSWIFFFLFTSFHTSVTGSFSYLSHPLPLPCPQPRRTKAHWKACRFPVPSLAVVLV
jgi:hypothetical protein